MTWSEKLGKFIDLERELKDKSTESKITRFGSRLAEKSMSELEKNFLTRRKRNPKLKIKLSKFMIINYKLMIHDERLGGKHII